YRSVLQMASDQPLQIVCEAHLGLARVLYEWNDLEGAERHGRQSLQLARQYERVIDRFILSQVFLARLSLARGEVGAAATRLAEAHQRALERKFVYRLPDVVAGQVVVCLHQGNLAEAARLAQTHDNALNRARVCLAQGEPAAALAVLEPWWRQAEAKSWAD